MIRHLDSCDHYATAQIGLVYTAANSGASINAGTGRNGTACLGLNHNQGYVRRLFNVQPTWIVGAAIKESYRCSGHVIFGWFDQTNLGGYQIELRITNAGSLQVTRNGTILATGTTAIAVGVSYYVEFKVTIHNTTGSFEVRINGNTEISGTAVNTRGTTTTNGADLLTIREAVNTDNTGNQITLEDIYVNDGTTAANNDFEGDIRIFASLPTAAGATTAWTPTPATNNYSRVNEALPDDDTSYVSSATVAQVDTYAMADLPPAAGTVKGVMISLYARKDDAGLRTIAPVLRIGGVDYVQANLPNLSTSYQFLPLILEVSPATGVAFTVAEVNALEAGVKMIA